MGKMRGLKNKRLDKRRKIVYALYSGEEFIAEGTADEIADKLNVKRTTIMHYKTPAYKKTIDERIKNRKHIGETKYRILIALDD